jgi:hypothetical protein
MLVSRKCCSADVGFVVVFVLCLLFSKRSLFIFQKQNLTNSANSALADSVEDKVAASFKFKSQLQQKIEQMKKSR